MRPDDRDAAYLLDMLEAARKVRDYVRGKTFADFEASPMLRDAVERNVEIIGEAARLVSDAFKTTHPEVPWRQIVAQRNVLVHQYRTIDEKELWEVAEVHIPRLIADLEPLVPPAPA